jgi:Fic family protein
MNKNYITHIKEILTTGAFSQTALAKRLGVTFAALNRWLNGHSKPHPARIEAIQKLHQEIVGFPSISEQEIKQTVRRADALVRKDLWSLIARSQDLQDELLLEHTYNSTSIEGTTFTKRETEAVIFDRQMVPEKPLVEHLEVTNHAAALKNILQMKNKGPLSEDLIKSLHKELLQGIREDAGNYSKHHRAIRGVEIALTHPKDISEEMGNLIRDWQKRPRKTIKDIASFHVHFELIHPFGDGNGRLGRLIMVMQCLRVGYPPVIIENARKAEYYDVLEYAQRKSERPFLCFLANEMERTSKILKKYGA